MKLSSGVKSVFLLLVVVAVGIALALWKRESIRDSTAANANQPELAESVRAAVAVERDFQHSVTAIGTVLALRSITLRNEVPGTVRYVNLKSGNIVGAGTVLVALDVSVEEAELKARKAEAGLARTTLERMLPLRASGAISETEVDQAQTQLNVALAQINRYRAIIARKEIRAPFRARVGIADLHPGQYIAEGTQLTTLQSVEEALHVDFMVPQDVSAVLRKGDRVDILVSGDSAETKATIAAFDARVDANTRSTMVRARIDRHANALVPGAGVRVRVSAGKSSRVMAIPATALRRGPNGEHVFVLQADAAGKWRAHERKVQVATQMGDDVLIQTGLSAGERVAATGSFKLRDTALVAIETDANAPVADQASTEKK